MSDLIVSTLTQGLIYALLSYGVYITYSVLDFPDLTVDSSFPLGAAVTAILLLGGVDPWLTLLCAAGAGALAGLCTGLIHVRLGVRDLLAGIITMTALSSVNLLIAGSNVTVERAVDTIFTSAPVMALLGDLTLSARKLIVALVLAVVVKLLLDLYFRTKSGLLLRAVGDNGTLVTTLAQNKGNMKVLGVVIANARAAKVGVGAYKTSTGAVLHIPIAQVSNLARAVERLKEAGFWACASTEHAEADVWGAPMGGRLALVMGSEGSGISRLVLEKCDFAAKLPQRGRVESLNVAQATTVMAYEWLRRVSTGA